MPTAELVEVDAANAHDSNSIILDTTMLPSVEIWSISIKTVGGRRGMPNLSSSSQAGLPKSQDDNGENAAPSATAGGVDDSNSDGSNGINKTTEANNEHSSNFTVQISPSDPLSILNERITEVTGLTKDEQRLIYRGRIIASSGSGSSSSSNEGNKSRVENKQQQQQQQLRTVGDIVGLANGQTIHLVPRIIPNNKVDETITPATVAAQNSERFAATTTTNGSTSTTLSGEAGLALLAALLGMNNNNNNNNSSGTSTGGYSNIQLPQQLLQPLPGVGIVRGTRMTTSAITPPPSARARATTAGGVDESGVGLGSIVHRASNMGVINLPSTTASATAAATATTTTTAGDIDVALLTGRELLLFPPLPNGVNNNNINNNNDGGGTNAEFASMLDVQLAASRRVRRLPSPTADIPSGDPTAAAAARYVSNQARLIASRLTESDLLTVPDPGGLEHVRQGMMTLHTMLGGSDDAVGVVDENGVVGDDYDRDATASSSRLTSRHAADAIASTPAVHRRWYRGQWLDALDTVHQWLEATVVDVVFPADVLTDTDLIDDASGDMIDRGTTAPRRDTGSTSRCSPPDAVVSANDLDGRRRLLLEPVSSHTNENEDTTPQGYDDENDDNSGQRYRPRLDNYDVQLLLIHYNGWPHRWDEWIRSDSKRIRPFRTRTRHRVATAVGGPSSLPPSTYHYNNGITNTNLACPTPHAAFGASPSTSICDEDDVPVERCAMLVELARITQVVNGLLQATALAASTNASISSFPDGSNSDSAYTTWTGRRSDSLHLPWRASYSSPGPHGSSYTSESISPSLDSARLCQLAPLLDRLGRTLTDAAPHIAALADTLPLAMPVDPQPIDVYGSAAIAGEEDITANEANPAQVFYEDEVRNLTARASHLYFGMGDNANNETPTATVIPESQGSSSPLADVLGLPPNNAEGTFTVVGSSPTDDIIPDLVATMPSIDPDLTDYVNGMINTTRGGVGLGRNSHRDNSMDSLGSSLLTSYLASMAGNTNGGNVGDTNGARTIFMGGGGGGGGNNGGLGALSGGGVSGIDIQIHAIVTNAGMGGVDDGFNTAGVLGPFSPVITPRNNVPSSAVSGIITPQNHRNDDDADLFSELYSESPDPVNFHGEENTYVNNQSSNDLEFLFEECQSISEEDSDNYKFSEDDNEEDENDENKPAIQSKLVERPTIMVDADRDDHIDATLESLSGNESNKCTTPHPQLLTSTTEEAIALTQISSNDRSRNNASNARSSSSLGRRLFRRMFGRMSGLSRRSG